MTALNVIVGGLAAYLVTDTAIHTRESHVVAAFAPKVATIPHLPAAVGVSGPAGLAHLFGSVLYTQAAELDELMAGRLDIAGPARQLLGSGARIVIAGWSRRNGAAGWHLDGDRFVPIPRGGVYASPAEAAVDWLPGAEDAPEFSERLTDLVRRQRASFAGIGGAVTLTTIRADSIEQRVLHRWPDAVGDAVGRK